MSDSLTERLNKILPRVVSNDFLRGTGIGNEIAFYIFDYPPEDELRIREHIHFLLEHIPKQKPGLRVKHINLFDFVLDYLKSRNLLDKVITMQRESHLYVILLPIERHMSARRVRRPHRRQCSC
jgi:hypothetical protein